MQWRELAEFVDRWNVGCTKHSVIAFKVVCPFVLISFLEVIHDLFGNGSRTNPGEGQHFRSMKRKTARKKFREQNSQERGAETTHGSIQQTLSRAWSELMPR